MASSSHCDICQSTIFFRFFGYYRFHNGIPKLFAADYEHRIDAFALYLVNSAFPDRNGIARLLKEREAEVILRKSVSSDLCSKFELVNDSDLSDEILQVGSNRRDPVTANIGYGWELGGVFPGSGQIPMTLEPFYIV